MLLKVTVTAGAAKNEIVVSKRGSLMVSVKDKPQENRANEKVRELVARYYTVPLSSVRIVKGHHRKSKLLELRTI